VSKKRTAIRCEEVSDQVIIFGEMDMAYKTSLKDEIKVRS